MANLATLNDAIAFVGDADTADVGAGGVLSQLVDQLELEMQRETGRFFEIAASGRTEVVDGTGKKYVYVSRPIAALTTIKVGLDFAQPWDTLDCSNPNVVIANPTFPRRIDRRDGAVFWRGHGNVQVIYDSAAYLPGDCKLALLEAVAFVYRRRGAEDSKSAGMWRTFNQELLNDLNALPTWSRVVGNRLKAPSIL